MPNEYVFIVPRAAQVLKQDVSTGEREYHWVHPKKKKLGGHKLNAQHLSKYLVLFRELFGYGPNHDCQMPVHEGNYQQDIHIQLVVGAKPFQGIDSKEGVNGINMHSPRPGGQENSLDEVLSYIV